MFIYGVNPVIEALKVFKDGVKRVILSETRKGKRIEEVIKLAELYGVDLLYERKEYLSRIAGTQNHQGVVGLIPEFRYVDVDEILKRWRASSERCFILVLDSIYDPQNLGAIIRNAEVFKVHGVIIPKNRSVSITPAVIKTSSGGVFHVPVARVVNLASVIDYLKDNDIWIVGASPEAQAPLYSYDFNTDISIVLGGEDKGIRPVIRKRCDVLLAIPIKGDINSLNVASAGAIFLYEVSRQRGFKR